MRNKKQLNWLIFCAIVLVSSSTIFFINNNGGNSEEAKADNEIGFTSEPITHDGLSYELIGSENEGTLHTFHFNVKNLSNEPIPLLNQFTIINGEKTFSSSDREYSSNKLNPNMEGSIDVTFEMNIEGLLTGEPMVEINRGFVFKNAVAVKITKE